MRVIKFPIKFIFIFTFTILIISCSEKNTSNQSFKSNFYTSEPRVWVGPEYWANPLQDWQLRNGELECLVSKQNRNVHLLTKKLDSSTGTLSMRVSLKLLSSDELISNKNWVGFSIGSKGQFNDYRDDAVFGKGLNIGITTIGKLFIDEMPESLKTNIEIQKQLEKGVDLEVLLTPLENEYQVVISLQETVTNTKISELSGVISADKLIGDLVLVSHFNTKKNSASANAKSVSFKNWELSGSKIKTHNKYLFGPILFSQYTLSKNTLKLTVQMAPVILNDEKVQLQIKEADSWKTINEIPINKDSRTATFKIEQWNDTINIPYRLAYKIDRGINPKETFYWEGIIQKDPIKKNEIVVAGFTGNDHLGFPNTDITNQVKFHNPDVLFFSGDQLYEPSGGFGVQRSPLDKAMLDYLRKWYLYGWAYRDLMKDRPTISITDDHDVFHGNIWGEGGKATPLELGESGKAQDAGGYKMPAQWVKMVERTQTSHLPDPYNKTPIKQGIGTYYTDMVYGGISFAIIEDRKFKSAPKALLPEANISNGWSQNKNFDMKKRGDVSNATLLGKQQLTFLEKWATDWSYQSQMKVLLSQTIFANVATLPKEAMSGAVIPSLRIMSKGDYPPNDRPVADLDSNGWPQSKRSNAIKIIRKGFAFHLAGDQHLGSTIQYGLDQWNDSGYAFCVPSISNHWPRRWYPSIDGKNRDAKKPKYTGEYNDGFGNKITVHAISNPVFTGKLPSRLYDRATGFGIVRFNKIERTIVLECWPRNANPKIKSDQYDGWPIKINQEDNYGRMAKAYLPEIIIKGLDNPVVQIINETTNEIIYAVRLNKSTLKPKIFDKTSSYSIKVGEPDENIWQIKKGIKPGNSAISFQF